MRSRITTLSGIALLGAIFLAAAADGVAQTYFYDDGSRLIKVAYPEGDGVRYGYDASDNLTQVAAISLPAAPSALSAAAGGGCAALSWRDNSTAETGFVVMRRPVDGLDWQDIARVDANVSRFTDCPPGGAAGFVYRVAADSAEGLSAFSGEQTGPTGGGGGETPVFQDDFENG